MDFKVYLKSVNRVTHRNLKPENIILKTKYIPWKALRRESAKKIIMGKVAGIKEHIAPANL